MEENYVKENNHLETKPKGNDYIVLLPYSSELVKINSVAKDENINYCIGYRIIIAEYLKRTVSEKYHVLINSFKVKVDSNITNNDDIQKIGRDTYYLFRESLEKELRGDNDIIDEMNEKIKEETKKIELEKEGYKYQEESRADKKRFEDFRDKLLINVNRTEEEIKNRYGYSDSLSRYDSISNSTKTLGMKIAEVNTLEEVGEVLENLGIDISLIVLKGLAYKIY